jgi:predicted outer membrane repeat protein
VSTSCAAPASPDRGILTRIIYSVLLLASGLASYLTPSVSNANAVVTLCHYSDEVGPGLNLQHALLAAVDPNSLINAITFNCGTAATIKIDPLLQIRQPTSIDGNNSVTLAGSGSKSLIEVAATSRFFYLYNLSLQNVLVPPTLCLKWQAGCSSSILNGQGVVQLHHVVMNKSHIPVSMTSGTLGIFDSTFTGDSDAVIVATGGTLTTISNTVFLDNPGASAVKAVGSLTITQSHFTNNDPVLLARPAGNCTLTVEGSTFDSNRRFGAIHADCDTSISHSTFTNNASEISGGALLFSTGTGVVTLRADRFLSNTSGLRGGAVSWSPPTNRAHSMTILYSSFTANRANTGGGLNVDDSGTTPQVTLLNVGVTSFSKNTAAATGGAIKANRVQLQVARGTFADNVAGTQGGAVYISNPVPVHSTLANALFVRNNASTGSALVGDDVEFVNSTVDSNVSMAIAAAAPRKVLPIKFVNTIIANNAKGGCSPTSSFADGGHNLQYPVKDCGSSIPVADPHLDTMYIPLPKSPPKGHGDLSVCMNAPINGKDVYGVGRPSGNACSIGAAEGDIQVLVHRRVVGSQSGSANRDCDCQSGLLKQLQHYLPFGN